MCSECRAPHAAEPGSPGRHGAAYRLSASTFGIASRREAVATLLAVAALLGLILFAHSLLSSNKSRASTGSADRVFVQDLETQATSAIDLAARAERTASSPRVTALASRLLDDERQQLARLRVAANSTKVERSSSRSPSPSQPRQASQVSPPSLIDGFVRHAQDDVITARIELGSGGSQALRRFATTVQASESSTIRRLNRVRAAWYGGSSPSGSVPGA